MKVIFCWLIIVFILSICCQTTMAQQYSIYGNFGPPYTLSRTTTVFSNYQKASVYSELTLTINFGIQKIIRQKYFIGVGIGTEDFDINQETKEAGFSNGTFSFRRLGFGTPVYLLEGYVRFGYIVPVTEKSNFNFILTPKLGYFPNGGIEKDTTESNTYERENATSNYLYLNINQTLRKGLNFLVNIAAEYELKLGQKQRFSLTTALAYQQGFRYFAEYTGYMGEKGGSEGMYTTKVNGSNIQFNLGLKYNFGFKQKVRMLQPF